MSAFTCRPHSAFAALVRSRCSECGSPDLWWSSAHDLAWLVHPADRLRLFDLIDFTGGDADAWLCRQCQNWGVFDATHAV